MNALSMLELCRECAGSVYANPPNAPYAESVARLLIGTAATESHLVDRRQHGFTLARSGGAWGLWQTEAAPMMDSMKYLKRKREVCARAADFLWRGEGAGMPGLLAMNQHCLLQLIHDWDRFACLIARLHYLRFAGDVPDTLPEQAVYYKVKYNTYLGAGSVGKYLRDWDRLVAPLFVE